MAQLVKLASLSSGLDLRVKNSLQRGAHLKKKKRKYFLSFLNPEETIEQS